MENKIIRCKTIHHGFNKYIYKYDLSTLVADIGMNEYHIRDDMEVLITYGIITCCGMVVYDKNNLMLAHLAPDVSGFDVISLLEENKLGSNSQILLFPGFACYVDYNDIINCVKDRTSNLSLNKFTGKYGVIYIDGKDLVMGNAKKIEKKFRIEIKGE